MHANSAIQNLRKQAEVGIFFWKLNGYSFKGVFPVTSKLKETFGTGNRIESRDHDLIEQKIWLDFRWAQFSAVL